MKDKYVDNSGDRKYFAMIPYYVVNHSCAYEQSLYLVMKRIASENGTCWASPEYIGKSMGCSKNTVIKYRKSLEKRGWIRMIGQRKSGKTSQLVREYEIVDLWEINLAYYKSKKVSMVDTLKGERCQLVTGKVSPVGNEEEYIYKDNTVATPQEFSFKNYIEKMKQSAQKHIQIIVLYWEGKGFTFDSVDMAPKALKREFRPATNLVDYELPKIESTIKFLKNEYDKKGLSWTLETVHKKIDDQPDKPQNRLCAFCLEKDATVLVKMSGEKLRWCGKCHTGIEAVDKKAVVASVNRPDL